MNFPHRFCPFCECAQQYLLGLRQVYWTVVYGPRLSLLRGLSPKNSCNTKVVFNHFDRGSYIIYTHGDALDIDIVPPWKGLTMLAKQCHRSKGRRGFTNKIKRFAPQLPFPLRIFSPAPYLTVIDIQTLFTIQTSEVTKNINHYILDVIIGYHWDHDPCHHLW